MKLAMQPWLPVHAQKERKKWGYHDDENVTCILLRNIPTSGCVVICRFSVWDAAVYKVLSE